MGTVVYRLSVVLFILFTGCASQRESLPISIGSSYACQPTPVAGQRSEGEGAYGCYFQLMHPETKKVLVNTPYYLAIYAPGESDRASHQIYGVTDEQGRSLFLRAGFPIKPEQVIFVQTLGKGDYSGVSQLTRADQVVAFGRYQITGCGQEYKGMTDERGYVVMLQCESAQMINVDLIEEPKK